MSDEQIIIDGVDVSGCLAFKYDGIIKKPICRSGGLKSAYNSCLCAENIDCDYKQLKRKEQECEALKFFLKQKIEEHNKLAVNYDACVNMANTKLKEKEQECEKKSWEIGNLGYKIKNQRKEINKLQQQLDQLKEENEELKEYIKRLHNLCGNETDKQYKYKQTLAEIKEIVGIGLVDGLQPEEYSGFLKILQAQILQKISESEVEK